MAETFSAAEDAEEGREDSPLPRTESPYLTFVERVSALCTLKRKDVVDSSDDSSDSAASAGTAAAYGKSGMAPNSGRSWMSERLGLSKKSSDQVRGGSSAVQWCFSKFKKWPPRDSNHIPPLSALSTVVLLAQVLTAAVRIASIDVGGKLACS